MTQKMSVNDFDLKNFNGVKAEFPAFAAKCLSTGIIMERPYTALLRSELMIRDLYFIWVASQPHPEDLQLDADTLYELSDDADTRDKENTVLRLFQAALVKALGPKVLRRLKEMAGEVEVEALRIHEIMDLLRTEYGKADSKDVKVMEVPIHKPYEANAGQDLDTYIETHLVAHETIAYFDNGAHSMQDTGKILAFCASMKPCGRYGAVIRRTEDFYCERRVTFETWTKKFLQYATSADEDSTTGEARYAASTRGREEETFTMTRAELIAAVAAAAAATTTNGPTHWCYLHGPNYKHNNEECHQKDQIPADKMKSTAKNPMGGPKPLKKRFRKKA